MPAVHGHGRGTRLGTCLVQQQGVSCIVAFATCVTANKCCVLFLILLYLLCAGMDEARALVRALCNNRVSPMSSPLLRVWLLINVVFYCWLNNTSCARAWTRHAPWYVPCAAVVCLLCCRLLLHAWLLINVVFCPWFHYTYCARAWTRHAPWYVPCATTGCLLYRRLCYMHNC